MRLLQQYQLRMYIEENNTTQTKQLKELEQDNEQIKKRVVQLDHDLYQSKLELQELVLRQAYNLDVLITHYPKLYPYPKNCIFSAIMNDYKKKSVSSHTIKQIYDIFDFPEYDRYKIHVYNTAKRRQEIDVEANGLGEKHVIDIKAFQTIRYIDENIDNPTIQQFLQRKFKEMNKQETKEKKAREDEEKETIPRPDFIPPDMQGQDSRLYQSILRIIETWKDIAKRVYQFPPEREEDDLWYAEGIDTLTALLVPGTDLKYVRDTLSYFDISYEKNTQSIHSAMSKSKILTPSNKWRKVTREQIADIDPQIILLAIHTIEKIPGLIRFFLYLMNEQKPYSGEFHLNRHKKLSESAFGNGSFID